MIYDIHLYQLPVRIFYVLSVVCFKESFAIEGKYTKNLNNYKIVYPIKVSGPEQSSSRYRRWEEDDEESSVHYQLNLGGNEEMIDLEPNYHILSPGAVLERRTNNISDNEPLSNIKLEEPSFTQCFFKGKVRNYEDSSTALSTCGGLCGYIRVKRHTYFIEPVERVQNDTEDQPHVLYEEEQNDLSTHNCATKLTADRSDKNLAKSLVRKNMMSTESTPEKEASSRSPNKRLHIETLLVLDRSMMDLHEVDDLQNYALTVFNMAQSLFHDLSTDPPIDLEIVRVIEVEDPKDILNFRQTRQLGTKELQTFSGWQLRINPKDENHPNHHDLAILLTGNDICDVDSCHYVGLAETNGACRPRRQAAICKDNGLMLGYIIAHQIAHTLGVDHDPAERTPEGITSVMSPVITLSPKVWSEESRSSLQSAIKKRLLHCLEDEPASEIKIADILPGVMYDADYQCQQLLTPDARSCTNKGDCQSLACEFEGTSCSNTGVMPAPGTTCDVNKWCFDGACLEAGQRPSAVEGNWGAWSEWSACSRTCGAGVSVSTRECNSPPPMHGGKSCNGNRNRHKICTTEPCDVGSDPFRDVQCAEYNDWVFPEDGQLHQWKGFFVSNGDPCALYCRNEKDVVVSLSPKVKDGTTCYRGTRDICVDGVCRDIPCDLQFDSNSVEDACGVCHGNGTGCKLVTGHMKFKKGTSKILSIPVGTRNIIVEETKHTPSQLIIKNPETNDVINEGKKLGMFNISGSMGWLGMKRPNQGVLEIPEPLAKPVEIWISSEGPQLISYSMGLPSTPRDGKYSWDYIDWSTCMAQCGDSYQETVPKCVEALSGHVEDRYCSQYQKPPIRRRSCNAGICLPRWLVGEWQECGPCPSKEARRFRIVRCIKPRAGSADGTTIVSDKVCPGSRPIGSEACRCIKRQVLYWPSPYRFDMLSNDFKILQKWNKGNKTSKLPEKKVTLMQLENENEESMLKQFKENQQKHHSIFYMPHVLGTRFNFSIPFKRKRQAIKTAIQNHDSLPLFNSNFIDYFPKPGILDLMKTGNKIMGNNFIPTSHAPKLFSLAIPTDDYSLMNLKRLRPISTYDPPPLRFSDENILKLLSQNLPLNKLKQQQSPNRNIKDPFKNLLDIPDPLLNDSVLSPPKEEKKADIIGMLMNEFHNVLATNTLIQPDTKNPTTTDSYISLIQSLSSKPRGSLFESGIQVSKQPLLSHNVSGLDEALSKLQKLKANSEIMNVSNGFINQKLNNLGFNNQRVTEIWAPPSADHEWENLLNAFRRYFFKKQFESKLKSTNEDIFLASTRPTASNDTSENINPFRFLTMKVTEKLNTLNTWDKLKAYQFFTALANNLHDSLSAVPQNEQELNFDDDTPAQENLFTPWRDNNLETEINKLKANGFFNVINKDIFRFNRSTNSVLNNNLQIFDKPIFSAEDLANINHMSHLQDRSVLVDNINKIDSPEFYQFKNKNKLRPKGAYKDKDKTTPVSGKTIIYTSNSFLKNYLNEFITNFFSNLHNGREKKETLQKSKANDIRRKERFVQECSTVVTCGRRITGLYAIPAERICPSTKKINRPKYILTRCRKNIAYFPWEKTGVKSSSEEETALARPGKVKIIKKKRHYMPCEESTRVCEELRRLFKDRMKNVTKLDPYECQRLREEIIHARFNLRNEQRLEKDLHNIINTNMTCLFRYSDYKETTTPFPAFNKFVNN